jgi:DNA-binding transcriptional regulator YiaG
MAMTPKRREALLKYVLGSQQSGQKIDSTPKRGGKKGVPLGSPEHVAKVRRIAEVFSYIEMAKYIGCHKDTVRSWAKGVKTPRKGTHTYRIDILYEEAKKHHIEEVTIKTLDGKKITIKR